MNKDSILKIRDLEIKYPINKNIFFKKNKYFNAVEKISFDISEGETLGLAGESGCGKSTIAKAILKILKFSVPEIIINGQILFKAYKEYIDIIKIKNSSFRKYRNLIQAIFQDPYSSINPRFTIGKIIEEPLIYNTKLLKEERLDRVHYLLNKVGIHQDKMDSFPFEFSGGQRQRINIARALVAKPELIIADEPVSSLDVSVQAQIINLFIDLKNEFKLSMLFISHDLSVIKEMSDKIAIMYLGKIVEYGNKEEVYFNAIHPYTKSLLSSIPRIRAKIEDRKKTILKGDTPDILNKPSGCYFRTRCPIAQKKCSESTPELELKSGNHYSACFFSE